MKSYTDLEQSKKLAEILPIESADMYWWFSGKRYYIEAMDDGDFNEEEGHIHAWSLAALLELIPITCVLSISNGHYRIVSNETNTFFHNNPLDAAFEMIVWLKENGKI